TNRRRSTIPWASPANQSIVADASTFSLPSVRKPDRLTRLQDRTRWSRSSCGIAVPSTCRKPSRAWRGKKRCAKRSKRRSLCRRNESRSEAMKKWNMIIDVAECTNCQLCTLATMDEYVDNEWPGYTAPMPKHGHKWINILQKERGQLPMID